MTNDSIRIYTQIEQGEAWINRYRGSLPLFACVLGFTETGLISGISAAGDTSEARKYTAIADAEFLYNGAIPNPQYPLPPLVAGASPVLISRAVVEELKIPVYLFNAGLLQPPAIPVIDLGGMPAKCLSHGQAMKLTVVKHLLEQGLLWGERLAAKISQGYVVLSECVVGGTTTALAVLTGLGINAVGKVNSSHPICNHTQKWKVVQKGLEKIRKQQEDTENEKFPVSLDDPLELVAAVGDPMQIAVAGMAIALSRSCGVMLAGGTQMLAVYALMNAIAQTYALPWQAEQIIVGTTRWVAEDPSGATVELAQLVGKNCIKLGGTPPPLISTQLSFADSLYPQLRAYEKGFVKEGVGAGGACIAAYLSYDWQQYQLLKAIETQFERLFQLNSY